jgi:hypothetical protein
MPPANRPPQSLTDIIQVRGAPKSSGPPVRPDRPHKSIGKGSRTRFLSVKKFRFGRVGSMLAIGALAVVLGFLTWAAIHLWG